MLLRGERNIGGLGDTPAHDPLNLQRGVPALGVEVKGVELAEADIGLREKSVSGVIRFGINLQGLTINENLNGAARRSEGHLRAHI